MSTVLPRPENVSVTEPIPGTSVSVRTIAIEINRQQVRREVPDRQHLGDFVREEGRQTGTHLGCEHGVCGACTVLVDGRPVRSCITFAAACDTRRVTTVEGYDDDPVVALLRPAFSRHHGLQCGYCTPGMLATARDIVLRLPDADEARVRLELAGNLCRCTGYMGITNAILDVLGQCRHDGVPAVTVMRAAQHPSPAPAAASNAFRGGFRTFDASDCGEPVAAPKETPPAATENTGGGTSIHGSFVLPCPPERVWKFMTDLPAVAGCLPGAELAEHSADRVKGRIAVKFGPMSASFAGAARLERDDGERRAVLRGAGQDSISKSRATGDVAYRVVSAEDGTTRVEVDLLYSLQGPLAQFSRSGLVKDFVGRMIQDFGRNVVLRLDPDRPGDAPLPVAHVNALGIAFGVLWTRIRQLLGRAAPRA